jgi:hypothetical protein
MKQRHIDATHQVSRERIYQRGETTVSDVSSNELDEIIALKKNRRQTGVDAPPSLMTLNQTEITKLQRLVGNRRTQTMLQRRRHRPSTAHVGGDASQGQTLEDNLGGTIAPGRGGYSRRMLALTGPAADDLSNLYVHAELTNVVPNTIPIEAQKSIRAAEKERFEANAGDFFNTPFTTENWQKAATWVDVHHYQIQQHKTDEEAKFQRFNAWVPRANGFFTSLRRLEAMQNMLGVNNPEAMASTLEQGINDAFEVAQRAQNAVDTGRPGVQTIDTPSADDSVTALSDEIMLAGNRMNTAYQEFQRNLLEERRQEIYHEGDEDRTRQQQIQEIIQFSRNVGKTIDVTMSVVSGAPAAIANATTAAHRAEATFNAARNRRLLNRNQRPRYNPTYVTVDSDGNLIVRNVQTGMDRPAEGGEQIPTPQSEGLPELPTSVADVLGGVTEFIYSAELHDINQRLQQIINRCNVIDQVSRAMEIRTRAEKFRDALNDYALLCNQLQHRIAARRQEYLEMGSQLDQFAHNDPASREAGLAPSSGMERFATIMTVVGQIREVLAVGSGALQGFDTPAEFERWANHIGYTREAEPPRNDIRLLQMPDEEWEAMNQVYAQIVRHHSNVGELIRIFGTLDERVTLLLTALHQGGGSGEH